MAPEVCMKKILVILIIMFSAHLPGLAVITPEESLSKEYIRNHGYSDEMTRLIDLNHAQINGNRPKYKSKDPDWYKANKKVNFLRKVFIYLDCGLDDGKFGKNDIEYTNRYDEL